MLQVVSLALAAVVSMPGLSLWKGEKAYVWQDVTNRASALVVMKPTSPDGFVRTGVAMPVRGEKDALSPSPSRA